MLDGAGRRVSAFDQSLPAMVLKVVLRLVPTRVKAAIAATAINAAIKAYSIAVTPELVFDQIGKDGAQANSPGVL